MVGTFQSSGRTVVGANTTRPLRYGSNPDWNRFVDSHNGRMNPQAHRMDGAALQAQRMGQQVARDVLPSSGGLPGNDLEFRAGVRDEIQRRMLPTSEDYGNRLGQARSDVQQAFNSTTGLRGQALRRMQQFGIDPSSPAFQARMANMDRSQALAQTQADAMARRDVDDRAMRAMGMGTWLVGQNDANERFLQNLEFQRDQAADADLFRLMPRNINQTMERPQTSYVQRSDPFAEARAQRAINDAYRQITGGTVIHDPATRARYMAMAAQMVGVPGRARGGPVLPGRDYLVGEEAPEVAIYPDGFAEVVGEDGPETYSPNRPATILPVANSREYGRGAIIPENPAVQRALMGLPQRTATATAAAPAIPQSDYTGDHYMLPPRYSADDLLGQEAALNRPASDPVVDSFIARQEAEFINRDTQAMARAMGILPTPQRTAGGGGQAPQERGPRQGEHLILGDARHEGGRYVMPSGMDGFGYILPQAPRRQMDPITVGDALVDRMTGRVLYQPPAEAPAPAEQPEVVQMALAMGLQPGSEDFRRFVAAEALGENVGAVLPDMARQGMDTQEMARLVNLAQDAALLRPDSFTGDFDIMGRPQIDRQAQANYAQQFLSQHNPELARILGLQGTTALNGTMAVMAGGGTEPPPMPGDRSQLVVGQTYRLRNGRLGRWTADGDFEAVQ